MPAVAAIGAVAFASHFAINSSSQTFQFGGSYPDNRSLYHAATDNVAFINRATARDEPMPRFWYARTKPDYHGMQSMYFYAFTDWLPPSEGRSDVRQRLDLWKPRSIVLLCEARSCGGARPHFDGRATRIARSRRNAYLARASIRLWTLVLRRLSRCATSR